MRPGQEAPDEEEGEGPLLAGAVASMRPGQEAPDENAMAAARTEAPMRFNEAGARSPG